MRLEAFLCLRHECSPLLNVGHARTLLDLLETQLDRDRLLATPGVFHSDASPDCRLGLELEGAYVRRRSKQTLSEVWYSETVIVFVMCGRRQSAIKIFEVLGQR